MTPEEMGAALGPGWARSVVGWEWVASIDRPAVYVRPDAGSLGRWLVENYDGGPRRVIRSCATPEAAVAVAHLLVAAERIADGAEVEQPESGRWVVRGASEGWVRLLVPFEVGAGQARRLALDLLRAADEATRGGPG